MTYGPQSRRETANIRFLRNNLATLDTKDYPNCELCGGPANLENALISILLASKAESYTRRYDRVLSVFADLLKINPRKKNKGGLKVNFLRTCKQNRVL